MEYKTVRPAQVLLDPDNPRLPDGTSNDREAINRLLDDAYEQLLALARDFATRGESNPIELPILVKDGSKYVVLDGNRRFAALKLLADPKLADDPVHQAAFARLTNKGQKPPKSLYCAVMKDREQADPWIMLRHTGANGGVGVRPWSAGQIARHRQRMKAPVDSGTVRSIAIADELTEAYQADTELVDLIKKVRLAKLTNIGRFFSGVTLSRMQFTMQYVADGDPQTMWAKHTADQLHGYFSWAFAFLDDNSVDAFKNDHLRGDLLNAHAGLMPNAASALTEYARLADHPYSMGDDPNDDEDDPEIDDETEADDEEGQDDNDGPTDEDAGDGVGGESGGADPSGSGRKNDKKPERCLYSEVRVPNLSPSIQRLVKEAKLLPIKDNYAVACVLSRVILELVVSDPKVLAWSGKTEGSPLAAKISACLVKLDPEIASKKRMRHDLMQAHLETSGIGVTYMHQFMHNSAVRADEHLARRFSSAYTPLLNSINEAVV